MKKMEVTGPYVEIFHGVLELTDEQAKARSYGLEATDKEGRYNVVKRVGFKRGERFGYRGPDLGRGFLQNINHGKDIKQSDAPVVGDSFDGGNAEGNPEGEILPVPDVKEMTVDELAGTLGFTQEDTIAILKDYGVKLKRGDQIVPADTVREVLYENLVKDDEGENGESGETETL
jgi:hypothetical protein